MPITNAPIPGFGAAITFSSGFCAWITSVDQDGITRDSLDTSHNAVANGYKTFTPGALADPGSLTVALFFNANTTPPITSAAETITVTFPKHSGATTSATWAASGFMTDFSFSAPMDGVMTATAKLKWSGAITITAET